jgi:hypothetical protein
MDATALDGACARPHCWIIIALALVSDTLKYTHLDVSARVVKFCQDDVLVILVEFSLVASC